MFQSHSDLNRLKLKGLQVNCLYGTLSCHTYRPKTKPPLLGKSQPLVVPVRTDQQNDSLVRVSCPCREELAPPAYQKYHALVSSAPPTLLLPYRYKLLEEMFRNADTVVSMLHNRSETCTFPKLKQAVQEMCRR